MQQDNRNVEAGLGVIPNPLGVGPGISAEAIETIKEGAEPKAPINIDDVLSGEQTTIGGKPINADFLRAAKAGDMKVLARLEQQIAQQNRIIEKDEALYTGGIDRYARIPGTTITARGERVVSVPDTVSKEEPIFGLVGDSPFEEVARYGKWRLGLNNAIKNFVPDPNVQELINDRYGTNFLYQFGRETEDFAKDVGFSLPVGAYAYSAAAATAMSNANSRIADPNNTDTVFDYPSIFAEEYRKANPGIGEKLNSARRFLNNSGIATSYAQRLNDQLIDDYIARFGEDAFLQNYRPPLNDGTGRRLYLPLITEEGAQSILDYGFNEMSLLEQFSNFAVENAVVAGLFGKLHVRGGKKKYEKYKKLKAQGKVEGDENVIPMRVALKEYELSEMSPGFAKDFRKLQGTIGDFFTYKFGYQGSIGTAAASAQFRASVQNVEKEITSLDKAISAANRAGKKGNNIISYTGPTGAVEKISYENALDKRNFLKNRHDGLVGKGFFSKFTPDDPFYKELLTDDLFISAGQTMAYNWIPSISSGNLSADTGGAIGAIGTALFRQPIVATGKYLGGGFDRVALQGFGTKAITQFGMIMENLPLIPRGALVNRNFEDISEALNRQLSPDDVEAFSKIAHLMENLTEEGVQKVYNSLQEYQTVRSRILSAFEGTDKYDEAKEAFNLSFAYASGLAPLQAIEAANTKRWSLPKFNKAVEAQLVAENSLKQAQLGMQRLNDMVLEGTGVDLEATKDFRMFVEGFQEAANGQMRILGERRRAYMELLDKYKTTVLKDPTSTEAEDVLTALTDLEIKMTPGAADDIEMQRTILTDNIKLLGESLTERMEYVDGLRMSYKHDMELGRAAEVMVRNRDEATYLLGRQVYAKAEKSLKGKTVDLGAVMEEMSDNLIKLQGGDIKQFFGADSAFFRGRTGRFAFQALEKAAERNLREHFGDSYDLMMQLARSPNVVNAAGEQVANPPMSSGVFGFVGEDASLSEIAMALAKNQSDEGIQFMPFQTTPFEAEELYRHLRNQGDRIANATGDADAKPYRDLMAIVDAKIKEIPGAESVIENAREEYRKLIFDPVAQQGRYGSKVDSATEANIAVEGGTTYARLYDKGSEPHTWHDDLAGAATKSIATGDRDAFLEFATEVDSFNRYWMSGTEGVEGNKIYVYDMNDPRNSPEQLEQVKKLMKNAIVSAWGDETVTNVLDQAGKDLGKEGAGLAGGYNFRRVENVRELQENLKIKVITKENPDGEIAYLADLSDMIAAENDIVDLIARDDATREAFADFRNLVNRRTGSMADESIESIQIDKQVSDQLRQVSQTPDALQFYEKYVVNYDVGLFQGLRDSFVAGYMREHGVSDEIATQAFNRGVTFQITKGLKDRAGSGQESVVNVRGWNGGTQQIRVMTNPVQLAEELRNKNVRAILNEVMDEEHIDFLQDLADMTVMSSGASMAKYAPGGIARGITPNEVISRAFNIARGMVSPTYVGAEFAFRVLQQMEQDVFVLAANNKEATRIMTLMLRDPGLITEKDMETLSTLLIATANRELIRNDVLVPEFVHPDEMEAAKFEDENLPDKVEDRGIMGAISDFGKDTGLFRLKPKDRGTGTLVAPPTAASNPLDVTVTQLPTGNN